MISINLEETNKNECKGLVFRFTSASYLSSFKSIETKKSLRLLKRRSCERCPKCEWIWELIQEDIYDGEVEDYLSDLKDQQVYKIKTIWHPGPYEYPNDGDMELEFIKVISLDKQI